MTTTATQPQLDTGQDPSFTENSTESRIATLTAEIQQFIHRLFDDDDIVRLEWTVERDFRPSGKPSHLYRMATSTIDVSARELRWYWAEWQVRQLSNELGIAKGFRVHRQPKREYVYGRYGSLEGINVRLTPRFIYVHVSNGDGKPELTYAGLMQKIHAKRYPPPTTIVFDRAMYNEKVIIWCPVWRLTPDTSLDVADLLQRHLSNDLGVHHRDGFVAWPNRNHINCPDLAELAGDTIRVYSAKDLGISLAVDIDHEL